MIFPGDSVPITINTFDAAGALFVPSAIEIASGTSGYSVIDPGDISNPGTGIYKIAVVAPTAKAFKVRVKITDSSGNVKFDYETFPVSPTP